jgi:hypothetical protein
MIGVALALNVVLASGTESGRVLLAVAIAASIASDLLSLIVHPQEVVA